MTPDEQLAAAKAKLHDALTIDLGDAARSLRSTARLRPFLSLAGALAGGFLLGLSPELRQRILRAVPRLLRRIF